MHSQLRRGLVSRGLLTVFPLKMSNEDHPDYDKGLSFGSTLAVAATGAAAFTSAPLLTGIFIGTAALSSGFAAYNYYKAAKDENEHTPNFKPKDSEKTGGE